MKQLIKYLSFLLLGIFALQSCSKDHIERRLDPSDFFVTFETTSGLYKEFTITEGGAQVITVTIAATKGSPVTVDFTVTPPTVADPLSAAFEILDMQNQPMTTYRLTFPEGTGAQSFKFTAPDNNLADGERKFELTLTANSAGYKLGIGGSDEGRTMPINVRDND